MPQVAAAAVPVHAGMCAVVVEGVLRADAALLTLDAAALRDGEGGATALAGRDTGAVLHGVGTSDSCTRTRTQRGIRLATWLHVTTRRSLTAVGHVRAKVDHDGEAAAATSVVGQRRAQARRPALAGV